MGKHNTRAKAKNRKINVGAKVTTMAKVKTNASHFRAPSRDQNSSAEAAAART